MKDIMLKPLNQAMVIALLMLISLLVFRLISKPHAGWNSTAILILVFCLWNSVAGIFISGIWIYLLQSVGLLVLIYFLSIFLSTLISGVSLSEFGESAMIYLAPLIYYPVFLVVMGLLRLFVPR